jgi:hypothetical protein
VFLENFDLLSDLIIDLGNFDFAGIFEIGWPLTATLRKIPYD